ncbi:MAG: FUSC family protein [Hyphomicrobiales bacterium]
MLKIYLRCIIVGLATIFSIIITYLLKLDYSFFSVVTVIVLLQLFVESLYIKALERTLGSALAFVVMYAVLTYLSANLAITIIIGVILTFIFLYFFLKDVYSYGSLFFGLTAAFMIIVDVINTPDAAIKLGYSWVFNVIIGAFTSILFLEFIRFGLGRYKAFLPHRRKQIKPPYVDWVDFRKFDLHAFIKAWVVIITIALVIVINYYLGWQNISLQAMIAIMVVMIQPELKKSGSRALHRISGVVLGSLIGLGFVQILHLYPHQWLAYVFVVIGVVVFTYLAAMNRKVDYIFLQAAVMIPLILMPLYFAKENTFNPGFATERSLGSLEGGFFAFIIITIFHLIRNASKRKVIKKQATS